VPEQWDWDYVHFPAQTTHVVVGAGDRPCAILMTGGRRPDDRAHYPVDPVAARHGASVELATDSPKEAYAHQSRVVTPVPAPWPPPGLNA
jgi:uncharacterized cupin superfamily protein